MTAIDWIHGEYHPADGEDAAYARAQRKLDAVADDAAAQITDLTLRMRETFCKWALEAGVADLAGMTPERWCDGCADDVFDALIWRLSDDMVRRMAT